MIRFRISNSYTLLCTSLLLTSMVPGRSTPRLANTAARPDADSPQAARLLALMGPSARDYDNDFEARIDLLSGLAQVCGGPGRVAPTLISLLGSREPETRRAAAVALRCCDTRQVGFRRQAIPALAARVDDPVTAVRLAAARTLEVLPYDSAEAPWQKALPPLGRALASSDADLRRTAARTLAFVPADVSSITPLLRVALHSGDDVACSYAVTALYHAAWSNPSQTLDGFLPDLDSPDIGRRRLAAADVDRAAYALWNGTRQPGFEPILNANGYQDNVATSRLMSWCLDVDRGVPPSQEAALAARRLAAADAAKPRLLAALVRATSDPDHAVRTGAASGLEKIGKWTDGMLSRGFRPNPGVESGPEVEEALAQATASLQATEPVLSKRLRDLNERIHTPHDTA